VIELQIIQNQCPWAVVQKLRALIEKCRVVLVRLDHKMGTAADSSRPAEIVRDAADQKARIKTRLIENLCKHRTRCRLAMRAGHCQHVPIAQHVVGQPLRPGYVAG
jgi:hypothetical protein